MEWVFFFRSRIRKLLIRMSIVPDNEDEQHTGRNSRASQNTQRTKSVKRSRETLNIEEVPLNYKETFINSGYRRPYSSMVDCIYSAFKLNNETFNIWTHLLPFVSLIFYFSLTFPSALWPLSSIDYHYYPLLAVELSVCVYLLGSTFAHTFNCMSPRMRHICFYIDYTAISMFGIGGACTTFYYLRPLGTGFFLFEYPNIFIGGAALCNVLTVYIACASRHYWERSKYIIRTLAFTVPLIYGNSPTFIRFLLCTVGRQEEECSHSLIYLFLSWNAYLVAALLNASRVPERFFPYTFDVFGHNHQWVHMVTTLGTLCHFWGVQVDLEVRKGQFPVLHDGLSWCSSLGWMFGTLCITGAIAVWFRSKLTREGHLKSD